jgi:hypothetical protein
MTKNTQNQYIPIHSDSPPIIPNIKHVPEFLKFVEWYAIPGQYRKPKNQKEFAKAIGMCEDALTDWKKYPEFWPLMYAAIPEWIKNKIPDVIGGLYGQIIKKGSAREVELFLKLAGIDVKNNKKVETEI